MVTKSDKISPTVACMRKCVRIFFRSILYSHIFFVSLTAIQLSQLRPCGRNLHTKFQWFKMMGTFYKINSMLIKYHFKFNFALIYKQICFVPTFFFHLGMYIGDNLF
uniref:Uncharacterized protein n=1 Tax=Cacopsylla melanoneura TaxID=428564 RepID=A0A8D8SSJ6_9HEMI